MSTPVTIAGTDIISLSRATINANFASLQADKVDVTGSYANPSWLTSLAGSKITGGFAGTAATATALATPRTIAGVAFDGTANIAIASTGLSDTIDLVRLSGSYANPTWLTALAASKLTGVVTAASGGAGAVSGILKANGSGLVSAAVAGTDYVAPAGNAATATLAALATALATARTIAGVAFDGTANIAIASTGLSDTAVIVRTSGSYADPAWITSLAASKVTGVLPNANTTAASANTASAIVARDASGNFSAGTITAALAGNASTATALATARTIAGVSFDGTANIAIPSTGLSDTANLVRNNQANTYSAGSKQVVAASATTAGVGFGGVSADPSSVSAGDLWYRTDLGTFGFRNASAVSALVAGGRALTTTGAIPFVTSSGVLGQDASNLFWDAANVRLGVGTNAPSYRVDLRENLTAAGVVGIRNQSVSGYSSVLLFNSSNTQTASFGYSNASAGFAPGVSFFQAVGVPLDIYQTNTHQARFATTGNLLINTTYDDLNNKLQVNGGITSNGTVAGFNLARRDTGANSWSMYSQAGDLSYFNQANSADAFTLTGTTTINYNFLNRLVTTGATLVNIGTNAFGNTSATTTQLIVRAGAGQSGNLTTWQNAAGTALAGIAPTGLLLTAAGSVGSPSLSFLSYPTNGFYAPDSATVGVALAGVWKPTIFHAGGQNFSSGAFISWTNGANNPNTTTDFGIARNSAGAGEVNSGIVGAYRDLYLRAIRPVASTVAALPTPATGMIATVTDATATTIGTTVAGGGANIVQVFYNGTAWRISAN